MQASRWPYSDSHTRRGGCRRSSEDFPPRHQRADKPFKPEQMNNDDRWSDDGNDAACLWLIAEIDRARIALAFARFSRWILAARLYIPLMLFLYIDRSRTLRPFKNRSGFRRHLPQNECSPSI